MPLFRSQLISRCPSRTVWILFSPFLECVFPLAGFTPRMVGIARIRRPFLVVYAKVCPRLNQPAARTLFTHVVAVALGVHRHVASLRKYDQILKGVVRRVAVDVVDNFKTLQWPTQMLSHYNAVFLRMLAIDENVAVSRFVRVARTVRRSRHHQRVAVFTPSVIMFLAVATRYRLFAAVRDYAEWLSRSVSFWHTSTLCQPWIIWKYADGY